MATVMEDPVKEVIDRFPEVGEILAEYRVGCVTCGVGTCLLKDVIHIHHLSDEEERAAMDRIARVVSADAGAATSGSTVTSDGTAATGWVASAAGLGAAPASFPLRYSPPMQQLVDEHVLIKRWLALLPEILWSLDVESAEDRQLVLNGVEFIRNYADKFHHAKEEDILFKFFDETQAIIQAMLADHDKARTHARGAAEAVERKDQDAVAEHLTAYRELLGEHIKKEDEILYPWMDRGLSVSQVGELSQRFADADASSGAGAGPKYNRFVAQAERILQARRERTR